MGELAFDQPFCMLKEDGEDEQEHFIMKLLYDSQYNLYVVTPVPWLALILKNIPGALSRAKRLVEWCDKRVEKRRQVSFFYGVYICKLSANYFFQLEPAEPDLMSYLLQRTTKAQSIASGKN